jgi:hypothetical protein
MFKKLIIYIYIYIYIYISRFKVVFSWYFIIEIAYIKEIKTYLIKQIRDKSIK